MRGLPTEPSAPIAERLRALPYFVHNLFPGIRRRWIELSRRSGVGNAMASDLPRLSPQDRVSTIALRRDAPPLAVVLNGTGILLGAIEGVNFDTAAAQVMNPAPPTIRPDMTHKLASHLLRHSPYLLITTAAGRSGPICDWQLETAPLQVTFKVQWGGTPAPPDRTVKLSLMRGRWLTAYNHFRGAKRWPGQS